MEESASFFWVFFCRATRWLMCDLWPTPPIYLFRVGGVNSDSIRVFNPAAEMLS